MALKRATKSLPLSGGINEEIDDFLLEPTGMQYIENARFSKKDTAEKAPPFGTGVSTGASNYTKSINGFWSDKGQRAAVIGNNEISVTRDAGASWSATATPHDLLGMERVLATAEQQGGMNYSCAPMGANIDDGFFTLQLWLVAFERVQMDSIDNSREVVMQSYDALTGQMIEELIIANAHSPKCTSFGGVNGWAHCWYSTTTGDLKSYACSFSGGFGLVFNASRDIQDYCQYNNRVDGRFDNQNYGDLRLGHAAYMHDNNAAFTVFYDPAKQHGVVAYKVESTGVIKIQFMDNTGLPAGAISTLTTDIIGTTTYAVLDATMDHSGVYAYILVGEFNNATNDWDLIIVQWDISGAAIVDTYNAWLGRETLPVNGSVRVSSDLTLYWAATIADGYPDETMQDTLGQHHVEWGRVAAVNWITVPPVPDALGKMYNHRLCSNIQPNKDNNAGLVVQQWANWNPADQTHPTGADQNAFTPTFGGKKPVTSVLVEVGPTSHTCEVIATFDAGQSKAVPFSSDEQSIHKGGDLWYWSDGSSGSDAYNRWHYGNRIMLTAEDTMYWMDRTAAPAWVSWSNPKAGARSTLFGGTSRFSVYHINSSVPVYSAKFPDGLMLGTSCPAWYDARGETLMSAGPLDSPEIVGATTSGDGITYMAYSDLSVTNEEPKVYQAVWLFTDSAGRVHRSAPSIPVYLGFLLASRTTTTDIALYVTAPIVLQRTKGTLYCEIYESWPGGVAQLASTTKVPTTHLDASTLFSVSVPINDTPDGATNTDLVDFRSSKAIYTAGDVLAADPWPNFSYIAQSGRRLFAASVSDPSTIYYSKTFEQNVAPEFSASLTIPLGNQEITALGTIDDKLIVFTDQSIWVVYGTGPDNTGANGDFFVEKMTHQIGCTDQYSIMTYQEGLAFYSNTTKEFHVLGRDLNLVDIGESVKSLSGLITKTYDSVVHAGEHELQWFVHIPIGSEYLAAGDTSAPVQPPRPWVANVNSVAECILVYNYKYQKWSLRTLFNTFSNGVVYGGAEIVGGVVGLVSQSYAFYKEDTTKWIWGERMKWETPWIKVNQLQDFGRFYGATFLGKYLSSWDANGTGTEAGDLQVTVKYDYEGSAGDTQVVRFRANQDFDPASGDRLQFEVPPSRQKCQAIKFVIEEIATDGVEVWEPTYTNGRGYILTGVDIHYGAKGGSGNKSLGAERRRG